MHILLKLIMARPHLLADHARAYAELPCVLTSSLYRVERDAPKQF